jgi:hypothetical protein
MSSRNPPPRETPFTQASARRPAEVAARHRPLPSSQRPTESRVTSLCKGLHYPSRMN